MEISTQEIVAAQLTTALYQKQILMKLNKKETTNDDIREVIEIWLKVCEFLKSALNS
jgi:hypothetical protein